MLQPTTIISGRINPRPWESGFRDYLEMGDNEIPAGKVGGDGETCATINDTWGFKSYDHAWKSTGVLVHKLVDIISKGGNYLLNVGPTVEGTIPQASVERLTNMGRWLEVNGESIYGATVSSLEEPEWGRYTRKPDKLYLHVFAWPSNGQLRLSAFGRKAERVYLLADPKRKNLQLKSEGKDLLIKLPARAPDSIDTVIALGSKDEI